MNLYFHETIDPVRAPGAHTRFLEQLGEVVQKEGNAEGSTGSECVAAWVPIFLTGHWPQIVTFWEMPGGWEGFADHFDHNPALFHSPLDRWYSERSGGFDRVAVGTSYTPSREELVAKGNAPVILQQLVTLRPGGSQAYLQRLEKIHEALQEHFPFGLLGAYETAFRNGTEAILLWSFPDIKTLVDIQARPEKVPALQQWLAYSREAETAHVGAILRPTSWSPLR
jgi:hypothetical protein